MSFVENLRMRNMFPINSDMGSAEIDLSGADPMEEIIQRALALRQSQQRPNGLQQVARQVMPQQRQQPMNVVSVGQSNPGAEMARSARQQGDRIYDSYNKPQITAGEVLHDAGIKPNEQFPGFKEDLAASIKNDDPDIQLGRELKRSQITNNKALADNRSNPKLKVVNIADPDDPTKQISANYDEVTGVVTPIKMDGGKVQPGAAAKANQAEIDKETKNNESRKYVKDKTSGTLAVVDELLDPTNDSLTEIGAQAVGKSSIGNWIPTTDGYSGAKSIARLKSLLTLDKLQEMKAQSKTGASGMGTLSNKDLGVLADSVSKLDTGLDEETFKNELKRIKGYLSQIMSDSPETSTTETPETSKTDKTTAPQAPEGYEYVRRPDNKGWTAIKKVGK